MNMKKKIATAISVAAVALAVGLIASSGAFFTDAKVASSSGTAATLKINRSGAIEAPMFTAINMLPGYEETDARGSVKFKNTGSVKTKVTPTLTFTATNSISGNLNVPSQLTHAHYALVVWVDGNRVPGSYKTGLVSEGSVTIPNAAYTLETSGATCELKYDIHIWLDGDAGNEYQGLTINTALTANAEQTR